MFTILWRYEIRPEHRSDFESAYGPAGDWAMLFGRNPGFRGTQLLRGPGETYLTVDIWRASADFDAFLTEYGAEYRALDARTEGWTVAEERLGEYEAIG